jgi:hypothetical protein
MTPFASVPFTLTGPPSKSVTPTGPLTPTAPQWMWEGDNVLDIGHVDLEHQALLTELELGDPRRLGLYRWHLLITRHGRHEVDARGHG